ncbi:hypothetical protein [Mycobacterium simiae]|uniref:hypothetical protein n=1 Tax=Mycobacterium simiae TaxID=1784 RepID=UPI002606F21C|nr:hypothetical protein [Mycobacterium simiae]
MFLKRRMAVGMVARFALDDKCAAGGRPAGQGAARRGVRRRQQASFRDIPAALERLAARRAAVQLGKVVAETGG